MHSATERGPEGRRRNHNMRDCHDRTAARRLQSGGAGATSMVAKQEVSDDVVTSPPGTLTEGTPHL
jgi:hypothetical protein